MVRRASVIVAAVVMMFGIGSPASARSLAGPRQASGKLICGVSGRGTFTPPFPSASNVNGSPVPVVFNFAATIGSCATAPRVGKAVINAGTMSFTAQIPAGGGCGDLVTNGTPDFTTNPNTVAFKWQSAVGSRRPKTAGTTKGDVFDAVQILKGWELTSDPFGPRGAFANETATIDLVFSNLGAIGGCAFGGPDLAEVDASSAAGSTITIAP